MWSYTYFMHILFILFLATALEVWLILDTLRLLWILKCA